MKYATEKTFDGQRASLGRLVVVCRHGMSIESGVVTAVWDNDIVEVRALATDVLLTDYKFVPTKTEECVNSLPEGSWTWPVRV